MNTKSLTWLIVLIIIINFIFGVITHSIAKKKLRSPGFFFLGFFLNLIGIIMALLLEDYRDFLRPLNSSVVKGEIFHNNKKLSIFEYSMWVIQYKENTMTIIPNRIISEDKIDIIEKKIETINNNGQINLEKKDKLKKQILDDKKKE